MFSRRPGLASPPCLAFPCRPCLSSSLPPALPSCQSSFPSAPLTISTSLSLCCPSAATSPLLSYLSISASSTSILVSFTLFQSNFSSILPSLLLLSLLSCLPSLHTVYPRSLPRFTYIPLALSPFLSPLLKPCPALPCHPLQSHPATLPPPPGPALMYTPQ